MIEYVTGDILDSTSEALVNTVNCVGIMGRGIALQFKHAFPENFRSYAAACKAGEVQPGRLLIFETHGLSNPKYIINFPTKRHWRGKSRLEDIDLGLVALATFITDNRVKSISIPPLGSGLGGLDWREVRPRIEQALRDLEDVDIRIFEPAIIEKSHAIASNPPSMTPGRAALVVLMRQYLSGLMDPSVTLLEVHKLMYFLQVAGEPLKLRYVKASHGPYAENLRHVFRSIEGHYVVGYSDGGDNPEKPLELIPGATGDAQSFLERHTETKQRFAQVAQLVNGFETPFGLELLATVHWVINNEGAVALDDVVTKTYDWNERKKRFSRGQIALAADLLRTTHWVASVSVDDSPKLVT
jgi:O-acetyl-ADP-ribose deacetylase (regulator of RNase III)